MAALSVVPRGAAGYKSAWEYIKAREPTMLKHPQCHANYFGGGWIERMRNRKEVCSHGGREVQSGAGTVEGPLLSAVHCSLQQDNLATESYCEARNVAIDIRTVIDYQSKLPPRKDTGGGTDADAFDAMPGMMRAGCTLDRDFWKEKHFLEGRGATAMLFRSLREVSAPGSSPAEEPTCVAWVDHPLYVFADRWHSKSLWHGFEDIFKGFESFAIHDLPPDTQVVVADARIGEDLEEMFNPIWPLVGHALSPVHPVTTLVELATSLGGTDPAALPQNAAICVRRAVFNIWANRSVQSMSGFYNHRRGTLGAPTPCRNSSVVRGLVDMIVERLEKEGKLDPPPPDVAAKDETQVVVTYPKRKTRGVKNEAEVLATLKDRFPAASIEPVWLDKMHLFEQMRHIRRTDVLFGLHGSALTWGLFLRDGSSMIEAVSGRPCFCHQSIATWMDHQYIGLTYHEASSLNVDSALNAVSSGIDSVCNRKGKCAAVSRPAAPAAPRPRRGPKLPKPSASQGRRGRKNAGGGAGAPPTTHSHTRKKRSAQGQIGKV